MVAGSFVTNGRSNVVGPAREVLPILREDQVPKLFARAVDRDIADRTVAFWENGGMERGDPVLRRPLTDAERGALERRASELRAAVAPWPETSRDTLLEELSGMFAAFPTMHR